LYEAKIGFKKSLVERYFNNYLKNITKPGECPLYLNTSDADGQRSRSHEAEDRFRGLVEV